jgi:hypothetical protein
VSGQKPENHQKDALIKKGKKKTTAIFTEDSSPSKSICKVSMSFASDNCILDGTT